MVRCCLLEIFSADNWNYPKIRAKWFLVNREPNILQYLSYFSFLAWPSIMFLKTELGHIVCACSGVLFRSLLLTTEAKLFILCLSFLVRSVQKTSQKFEGTEIYEHFVKSMTSGNLRYKSDDSASAYKRTYWNVFLFSCLLLPLFCVDISSFKKSKDACFPK